MWRYDIYDIYKFSLWLKINASMNFGYFSDIKITVRNESGIK